MGSGGVPGGFRVLQTPAGNGPFFHQSQACKSPHRIVIENKKEVLVA